MRRWLSFVLSMSLIASLVLSNPAVAFEASIIRKPIKTIDASHVSTRLGADINSITYSNLRVNIENGRDSNCRMTFTLHVGPDSYEINVAGQLEERVLSESNSIFHGCLRGTVEIKGTKYNVTAGLTKAARVENVSAGIVLMPVGSGWSNDIISFAIGDYVVPENVSAILLGDNAYNTNAAAFNASALDNRGVVYGVSIEAQITDYIAQSIGAHVTPNMDIVSAYVNEHFAYTDQGGGAWFSLDSLQVGVRESSNMFNLVGIYTNDIESDDTYDDFRSLIWAVVFDMLVLFEAMDPDVDLNIPLNTLAWFTSQTSNPVDQAYADNYSITLTGSELFDGIGELGVACAFATSGNTMGASGGGTATAYGNASFLVVQNIPLSGAISFYIDAYEATCPVYVMVGVMG